MGALITLSHSVQTWRRLGLQDPRERERLNFLRNSPLPENPPHLFVPTRIRVLKGFWCDNKQLTPGTITTVPWVLARDMQSIKRAEILPND